VTHVRYLDHAATTPLRPGVAEAMAPYLGEVYGNPSGVHAVSRRAKNAMEEARERAAALLGASRPLDVVFTSGGTESDNLAVAGAALSPSRGGRAVVTAVEHEAVLAAARFAGRMGRQVIVVPVGPTGVVAADDVLEAIGDGAAVVSVMAANNETGARQPVRKVADAVRSAMPSTLVHTDAVQAFCSDPVTVVDTGAALITLAGHKLGGPKGIGLLVVPAGADLEPVVHGGGQELGVRSGTPNVAGTIGMVAAMEAAAADRGRFVVEVGGARDGFERRLTELVPDVTLTVAGEDRIPQIAHVRVPGVTADTLLIRLDEAGVAASAGSACSSGAIRSSHVLRAMGIDGAAAAECVRFSFGWPHRLADGPAAAEEVAAVIGELR
jgi:cysteine desulfurase